MKATADNAIALSHLGVHGLLLVVNHSSHLLEQRELFQSIIGGADFVSVFRDQVSPHCDIADSVYDLKYEALYLRDKIDHSIASVTEKLAIGELA